MHGTRFQKDAPMKKKRGTIVRQPCGVQCALTFARVCKEKGAGYSTLDEWCKEGGSTKGGCYYSIPTHKGAMSAARRLKATD